MFRYWQSKWENLFQAETWLEKRYEGIDEGFSKLIIMLILGTRPQIIKSAPIINESLNHAEIDLKILHTGQHYDDYMSDVFFRDLCENFILDNLNIGPGSSPTQIGSMIKGIENSINEINPDLVLIPGDTNSAISAAITASKMNVELAHFEAGARLGVSLYPEEINRRMIDQAADLLLTPSIHCKKNLKKENYYEVY